MRRLFWMGVGAAVTVAAARRARRSLGPVVSAAAPVTAWFATARGTIREITETAAAHEAELRAMLIEDVGQPESSRQDPRRPVPRSWASRVDDDDEPYSF